MMENLEKVEKIRANTGVTYEDAKNALEACNYDILDAIVYLEKLGKIQKPQQESYKTNPDVFTQESERFTKARANYEEDCKRKTFGDVVDTILDGCKKLLKKSIDTKFVVFHKDEVAGEMPVLVLIILMMAMFWVVVPLMIVGMFFDFRYNFKGVDKFTVDLNEVCDKASNACENFKKEHETK